MEQTSLCVPSSSWVPAWEGGTPGRSSAPAGSRPEAHLPGSPCASAAGVGPTLTLGAAGGSETAALFLLEQGAKAHTW